MNKRTSATAFTSMTEAPGDMTKTPATADVLADYLTWKELIHTSYFDQDRFIKLVAYAIGQSGGFKTSPALISDSDYPHVVRAYETITTGAIADKHLA